MHTAKDMLAGRVQSIKTSVESIELQFLQSLTGPTPSQLRKLGEEINFSSSFQRVVYQREMKDLKRVGFFFFFWKLNKIEPSKEDTEQTRMSRSLLLS